MIGNAPSSADCAYLMNHPSPKPPSAAVVTCICQHTSAYLMDHPFPKPPSAAVVTCIFVAAKPGVRSSMRTHI